MLLKLPKPGWNQLESLPFSALAHLDLLVLADSCSSHLGNRTAKGSCFFKQGSPVCESYESYIEIQYLRLYQRFRFVSVWVFYASHSESTLGQIPISLCTRPDLWSRPTVPQISVKWFSKRKGRNIKSNEVALQAYDQWSRKSFELHQWQRKKKA